MHLPSNGCSAFFLRRSMWVACVKAIQRKISPPATFHYHSGSPRLEIQGLSFHLRHTRKQFEDAALLSCKSHDYFQQSYVANLRGAEWPGALRNSQWGLPRQMFINYDRFGRNHRLCHWVLDFKPHRIKIIPIALISDKVPSGKIIAFWDAYQSRRSSHPERFTTPARQESIIRFLRRESCLTERETKIKLHLAFYKTKFRNIAK